MKFFFAQTKTVPGPTGSPLTFILCQQETTEETFNTTVDNYIDSAQAAEEKKTEARQNIWKELNAGKGVVIDGQKLFISK